MCIGATCLVLHTCMCEIFLLYVILYCMSCPVYVLYTTYVRTLYLLGTFTCSVGTANASCCILATPLCSVGTIGASFCMLGTPSGLYGTATCSVGMLHIWVLPHALWVCFIFGYCHMICGYCWCFILHLPHALWVLPMLHIVCWVLSHTHFILYVYIVCCTCLVPVQPFYIVCTLMFVYCILELVPMSTHCHHFTVRMACVLCTYFYCTLFASILCALFFYCMLYAATKKIVVCCCHCSIYTLHLWALLRTLD